VVGNKEENTATDLPPGRDQAEVPICSTYQNKIGAIFDLICQQPNSERKTVDSHISMNTENFESAENLMITIGNQHAVESFSEL
jgi:hypothetical protein